jgi:hypothetical protein
MVFGGVFGQGDAFAGPEFGIKTVIFSLESVFSFGKLRRMREICTRGYPWRKLCPIQLKIGFWWVQLALGGSRIRRFVGLLGL